MKDKYIRLKAMLLAGIIALTSSSLSGCGNKEDSSSINYEIVAEATTTMFDIGEHIISVPILTEKDIRYSNVQYDYYPGYEPIGISITAHGKYDNVFGGGTIIYANTEKIECSSNLVDENGNYVYLDFGTPMDTITEEFNSNDSTKVFNVGEHIISVPISEDARFENFSYDYHNGYEVVGIATSAYGALDNDFAGGVLLYKNITPVQCIRTDNGYTSFGVPLNIAKARILK